MLDFAHEADPDRSRLTCQIKSELLAWFSISQNGKPEGLIRKFMNKGNRWKTDVHSNPSSNNNAETSKNLGTAITGKERTMKAYRLIGAFALCSACSGHGSRFTGGWDNRAPRDPADNRGNVPICDSVSGAGSLGYTVTAQ